MRSLTNQEGTRNLRLVVLRVTAKDKDDVRVEILVNQVKRGNYVATKDTKIYDSSQADKVSTKMIIELYSDRLNL